MRDVAAPQQIVEPSQHGSRTAGWPPGSPAPRGNLATEDLVYLDIATGVDLGALLDASAFMESRVGHLLPSRYYRAANSSRR